VRGTSGSLRVLAVATLPFPSPQGTQVLIGEMAEGLAARGHDVHLLCYGWGSDDRGHGFALHRVANLGAGRSLRSGPSLQKLALDALVAAELRRLVAGLSPDVVLAHGHEALAAAVAPPGLHVPVVYHAHTRMTPELPTYFTGHAARFVASLGGRALDALLPQRADAIVAVSAELAAELGGTHVPPALRLPPRPTATREPGHLVYTGNLDRYQGIDALLDALAALPSARLTIASASSPGPVAAGATRRGVAERVRFVPHADLTHVRALLARAAVVVVPRALRAGFPVKLLEAMAAAAPLVVARPAAHGLTHGREAIVVDEADMPAAIASILADPAGARAMGDRARRHVEQAHAVERSAFCLEQVLRSAAT
jgi:glycosyltransferase involved in cell wall biosynthesis